MSWKLSVCEPIPRFDRGKNYITTFYSGHTAGGTTLVINDYQIAKFFLPGDILTLGPSTAAGYEGATERVVIVSATTFVVTMLAATSNSYSAGDNISGVASGSSDGWSIISGITSDAIFTPMGWGHIRRSDLSGKQGQPAPSFGNQATGQYFKFVAGTHDYTVFGADIIGGERRSLLTGVPYRLGGYFFFTSHNHNTSSYYVYCSSGLSYMAVDIAYAGSAWEKKETATATTLTKASVLYDYSIRCKFNFTAAFSIGGMDCLYLTHASMTSGVADGVYTFTSDPNGGISEIIRETTNKQKLRTFGHTLYTLDANPAQIRGYRAKFLDADVTMLRNLEVFQYWQNLGYTLMLEPDIENARPLFGVMDYNFSYEHWDDNRITVDFEFVGV